MKHTRRFFKTPHWWYWLIGPLALLWIALRSGTNPKRLAYPCQQAAMPVAFTWLAAVAAFFAGGLVLRRFAKFSAIAIIVIGIVWFISVLPESSLSIPAIPPDLPVWHIDGAISQVYVMDEIPPTSGSVAAGDATVPDTHLGDPAIDTLLELMAAGGTYLHRGAGHPEGIVGSDDIVIIKGNFQWTSYNTTSTDRIKGLIWQILNHPDGFTGEIIVADNIQNFGVQVGPDDNNSEDPEQSIDDVVNTFNAKGYPVYLISWASFWSVVVEEYADDDYDNGYTYDPATHVTYPKFTSPSAQTFISMRYGIWDFISHTYDPSRLCIIDFPVLKSHTLGGATVAIKNWVGMLTTAYYTQRYGGINPLHDYYFFGEPALVARVMAVTFPKLTIVDAAWTTGAGPIDLVNVYNTNMLLGSTDPAAVSWYAAKFILTPLATNPANSDPDNPSGLYGRILPRWTTFLRDSAGFACTEDSTEMAVYDRRILCACEEPCDPDGDFWKSPCDNCPDTYNPSQEDLDGDGIGDSCEVIRAWHIQADGLGDAPTIQEAIDSCMHGDTVLVADGVYTGEGNYDLDFHGRRILITSENGPEAAIIDCQADQVDPHRAFTFTSGEDESFIIDGLTFRGGYGQLHSGGNCGGAMFLDESAPLVKNCIFTGNSATLGGAIFAIHVSLHPVNCTFVGNTANYGAAVFAFDHSDVTLENCIIAFNEQGQPAYCLENSTVTLSCSDVYGNIGGDWVGCLAGQDGINGNFSADPLFCNEGAGLYGLRDLDSPCAPSNNDCGVLIGAVDVSCPCDCGVRGDVNCDAATTPVDVSYLVKYVYMSQDALCSKPLCPYHPGDLDCHGGVTPVDVAYLVNYVFKQLDALCDGCAE